MKECLVQYLFDSLRRPSQCDRPDSRPSPVPSSGSLSVVPVSSLCLSTVTVDDYKHRFRGFHWLPCPRPNPVKLFLCLVCWSFSTAVEERGEAGRKPGRRGACDIF
jgi:hypothetical protein